MRYFAIAASLYLIFVSSACVPKQQYTELEQTLAYYKGEALSKDSIRATNLNLQTENNQTQADYQGLTRNLERLTATNISLNRNYQDIVNRYNQLVGENQKVLAVSSYETASLEQELALRREELDQKERSLNQMEGQMRNRDAELRRLEAKGAYDNSPNGYGTVTDARFNDLRVKKAAINQRSANLHDYFQRVLVGFPLDEVDLSNQDGMIKLSLSQALLFPQEEGAVYWKGRQALQQISVVLRENPDLKIRVVGHTNPSSNANYDWETSLFRALAVTKDLNAYGVDAARLSAGGEGGNQPIVPATNARAQIVNGRTDIIIPLNYNAILQALD